jgi:cholesterol transport system auxiliary component
MNGWLRAASLPALALLTTSCTITALTNSAGKEATQFHTLSPEAVKPARARESSSSIILLVSSPRAYPGYDAARMVYLIKPYTLGYFAHNQWVDTPQRMLGPLVARAMEATGRFFAVVQTPTSLPGAYRLDTDIVQLQQEFLQRPSQYRIMLSAMLADLRSGRLLGSRSFEAVEPAPSDDPYGGVVAANRALARLLRDMGGWVVSLLGPK